MSSEPRVQASILARFDAFLASKGVNIRPLLPQAGLRLADLKDSGRSLPLNAVATLLDISAQEAGDPCLGLHFAESLPAGSAGVLGHLVMSAPTVRDALRGVERYTDLFVSPITISFTEKAGRGVLSWRYPDTFTAPRLQYSGLTVGALLIRLQQGAGVDLRPLSAEFDHRAFPCPHDVRRIFGPRVRFDRPLSQLVFDTNTLNRRIAGSQPGLFDLIGQLGDRLLEEQRQVADIVELTRRQVAARLRNGGSGLEQIAGAFGISPRTLQGRLKRAGTTFETLVDTTRHRLAESYLRDTDLTMTEIAFMLGFSELSAFTRAAHRWFRMSPTAYRRSIRRKQAPRTR
ncbi:MAG: AraC family transcriptional regulator [Bacteroidota bacterium]|jgi:AraC-like DNA-binding protein